MPAARNHAPRTLTQRVGDNRPDRRPRRPRLTPDQRREKDARLQWLLKMWAIEQVVKATFSTGWFTMSLDEFRQGAWIDDGEDVMLTAAGDRVYRVSYFDGTTVYMRAIA